MEMCVIIYPLLKLARWEMTEDEMKEVIDGSSYEQLLSRWRFAKPGNPFFFGEVGEYYSKVMFQKRDADPDGAVRASKSIGW
jgi:hypothetical protein